MEASEGYAELELGGPRGSIYGDGFHPYFQGVVPISSGRAG